MNSACCVVLYYEQQDQHRRTKSPGPKEGAAAEVAEPEDDKADYSKGLSLI
jgi:hypothetical protein